MASRLSLRRAFAFAVTWLPFNNAVVPDLPLTPHLIHEFPKETYIHSIAIRKCNNDILAAISTAPEIYLIPSELDAAPVKIATLPGVQAATGIVEGCEDEFYLTGGNLSISEATSETGSYSVWKLNLSSRHEERHEPHKLVRVAAFPEGKLLSRITHLLQDVLLLTDSIVGAIWSLNLRTNETAILYRDPLMTPISSSGVGINAAVVRGNHLYFGNSERALLARVPIDTRTGKETGPYQVLYRNNGTVYPQGFDLKGENLWLASGFNEVDVFTGVDGGADLLRHIAVTAPPPTNFAGTSDVEFAPRSGDVRAERMYVSTVGRSEHEWVSGGAVWSVYLGET